MDRPYYNSAESTPWESAGSSPDSQPTHNRPVLHRTSPVSPKDFSVITPPRRRSALRQQGRPSSRPAKSVQWVSDLKKKPQDISSDRKIVKVQVEDLF